MAKEKTAAQRATAEARAQELAAKAAKNGPSAEELAAQAANNGPRDDKLAPTKGVVARGRTVTTEHGTFTAGMVVTSTKDEIARLRRLKFLVDPRENLLPLGNGPKFFQEDAAAKDAPEPA